MLTSPVNSTLSAELPCFLHGKIFDSSGCHAAVQPHSWAPKWLSPTSTPALSPRFSGQQTYNEKLSLNPGKKGRYIKKKKQTPVFFQRSGQALNSRNNYRYQLCSRQLFILIQSCHMGWRQVSPGREDSKQAYHTSFSITTSPRQRDCTFLVGLCAMSVDLWSVMCHPAHQCVHHHPILSMPAALLNPAPVILPVIQRPGIQPKIHTLTMIRHFSSCHICHYQSRNQPV